VGGGGNGCTGATSRSPTSRPEATKSRRSRPRGCSTARFATSFGHLAEEAENEARVE